MPVKTGMQKALKILDSGLRRPGACAGVARNDDQILSRASGTGHWSGSA